METIELKKPFKSPDSGVQISQVDVREAKVGDIRTIAKMKNATQEEKSFELVRRCVLSLSPAEFDEIGLVDFVAISSKVNEGAVNFPLQSSDAVS